MRLWDLSHTSSNRWTPSCVAIGIGHTEGVGCICLSKRPSAYTEKRLVAFSASGDKIIKRWNLRAVADKSASQKHLQATHSMRGHEKDINTVLLSPNDSVLASGGQDKMVKLWNAEDLSAIATLRGHKRGKNSHATSQPFFSLFELWQ